jgi:hypothetical protein
MLHNYLISFSAPDSPGQYPNHSSTICLIRLCAPTVLDKQTLHFLAIAGRSQLEACLGLLQHYLAVHDSLQYVVPTLVTTIVIY